MTSEEGQLYDMQSVEIRWMWDVKRNMAVFCGIITNALFWNLVVQKALVTMYRITGGVYTASNWANFTLASLWKIGVCMCRLSMIASDLCVRDQHLLINRLHSYWLLKRHARHGLPLLHRIQYYLLHRVSDHCHI